MPELTSIIRSAGVAQLGILIASSLVPIQLNWRDQLASLPKLLRQLFWVYGAYVVLGILMLGITCTVCAKEIVSQSPLALAFCCYGMLFWGIRLALQALLDAKPFLSTWWLTAGYHLLTVFFSAFTVMYAWLLMTGWR